MFLGLIVDYRVFLCTRRRQSTRARRRFAGEAMAVYGSRVRPSSAETQLVIARVPCQCLALRPPVTAGGAKGRARRATPGTAVWVRAALLLARRRRAISGPSMADVRRDRSKAPLSATLGGWHATAAQRRPSRPPWPIRGTPARGNAHAFLSLAGVPTISRGSLATCLPKSVRLVVKYVNGERLTAASP